MEHKQIEQISDEWHREAVKEFGEDTAKKMWQYARDPVTGYVSSHLNSVDLLDGKVPCQRCGGFGIWYPPGGSKETEVLCLRCFDDWEKVGSGLLHKHGYVSSKKKWRNAFMEFCATMPN